MSANRNNTFVIDTGSVRASLDEASVSIYDMINMLRAAQRKGAEYVTLTADYYYGPYFLTLHDEGEMASDLYAPLDEDPTA